MSKTASPLNESNSIRVTLDGKKISIERDENQDIVLYMEGNAVALDHAAIEQATKGINDKTLRGALHAMICGEIIETNRLEILKGLLK